MDISVATWNINSVRLRLPILKEFLGKFAPDILCLQETKCPDNQFPVNDFQDIGYKYVTINGQKSYNGVAIISKIPFVEVYKKIFCTKDDARHISVELQLPDSINISNLYLHNFYVPAGGDEPDININQKFAHKLDFIKEMKEWFHVDNADYYLNDPVGDKMILVGDLNIAPLEHDVWSHKQLLKVVSHTPIEIEHMNELKMTRNWLDVMRHFISDDEKLYSWWSYRAKDWAISDKGRRLDHVWVTPQLRNTCMGMSVIKEARGWKKPSDHAPVLAHFNLANL